MTLHLRSPAAPALVRTMLVIIALAGLNPVQRVSAAARTQQAPAAARAEQALSAAQIVERHIAARGGLGPWQKVETMTWLGRIEGTSPQVAVVPFMLQTKHPGKTRFELRADEFKAVRTYDGDHGWILRQTRQGRPDMRAFTGDEMRYVKDAPGFAGVLIEHAAERLAISLEGIEPVDGRSAYRLAVALPSGARHHVWIDTQTFLDVKYDRPWHGTGGQEGTVAVFNRAFGAFDGLQVPTTIEVGGGPGKASERMTIEKVVINPPLDDRIFAMPRGFEQGRQVTVDMRAKAPGSQP